MTDSNSSLKAVFRRCVRCGYSLRGLPATHACPECGLRFDAHCGLYPAKNPKAVMFLYLCIFSGGWINLRGLPALVSWSGASTSHRIQGLAAVGWLVCLAAVAWSLIRVYRRGQKIAVTVDGLIVHLAGHRNELIPWSNIGEAQVTDRPRSKRHGVSVYLKDRRRFVELGGPANVFPTREVAERFIAQVDHHVAAAAKR